MNKNTNFLNKSSIRHHTCLLLTFKAILLSSETAPGTPPVDMISLNLEYN